MVAYGIAKARAMANRTDWNERAVAVKEHLYDVLADIVNIALYRCENDLAL